MLERERAREIGASSPAALTAGVDGEGTEAGDRGQATWGGSEPLPRGPDNFAKLASIPFILLHVACICGLWIGFSWGGLALCLAMYFGRSFFITTGYHRYLAHRSFKTSRVYQFIMAWMACSSAQKGPLWWAAHHRTHHRFSDQPEDVHSPLQRGFWYSHVGWILSDRFVETDFARIRDFARFPELRWLNRWHLLPFFALLAVLYAAGGTFALYWGGVVSTVLLWHTTFTVNSLAHVWGKRRFETTDTSRNNWLIALFTGGEGWHNNHHHHMSSANQGFYWWEIDTSFYVLRVLEALGVIWDVKRPPAAVLEEGRRLDRARAGRPAARESVAPAAPAPSPAPATAAASVSVASAA